GLERVGVSLSLVSFASSARWSRWENPYLNIQHRTSNSELRTSDTARHRRRCWAASDKTAMLCCRAVASGASNAGSIVVKIPFAPSTRGSEKQARGNFGSVVLTEL